MQSYQENHFFTSQLLMLTGLLNNLFFRNVRRKKNRVDTSRTFSGYTHSQTL